MNEYVELSYKLQIFDSELSAELDKEKLRRCYRGFSGEVAKAKVIERVAEIVRK